MHYKTICDSIVQHIRELISSEDFLSRFKKAKRFVRKRLLSIYQVIIYLINSNRASMSINIGNIRDKLTELNFPNVSKQALSRARQFIHPDLFKELFKVTVSDYYDATDVFDLWNGFHLFAIDGTQVHMPYSKSVAEDFGIQGDPRYAPTHYMGLGSVLYDISQDIIVDAAIGHSRSSERDFAREHIKVLKQIEKLENSLIIFDRGYYSSELFQFLADHGCFCLMRIRASITSLTKGEEADVIRELKKAMPGIHIRCLQYPLCTGETEYLVTNLLDSSITAEMFGALYHERWKVESKYYEIKERWELESFNGATSRAVSQEFYITLMKSNYCAVLKKEADRQISEKESKESKNHYQCCRSHLIGRVSEVFPKYLIGQKTATTLEDLLLEGIRNKSLIRKGRHDKRKMPKKHKVHSKNRKTTT